MQQKEAETKQKPEITRGIRNQKLETRLDNGTGDAGTQGQNRTDDMTKREGKTRTEVHKGRLSDKTQGVKTQDVRTDKGRK